MHGWVAGIVPTKLAQVTQRRLGVASQPSVCADATFTTLALKNSPDRFSAYSAAWSARRWRYSLVAVRCSNRATFEDARMMSVRMNRITRVTIRVATPRCFAGTGRDRGNAFMGRPASGLGGGIAVGDRGAHAVAADLQAGLDVAGKLGIAGDPARQRDVEAADHHRARVGAERVRVVDDAE